MSGRRRRDDGWDDGARGAADDGRDPWADSAVDDWADSDRGQGDNGDWAASADTVKRADRGGSERGQSERGRDAAGGYAGGGASPAFAPAFPTFQANGSAGNRERGTAGGYDTAGYGDDRYGSAGRPQPANGGGYQQDPGYGQDAGLGRAGSGGRPPTAGPDAAFGGGGNPGYAPGGYGNDPARNGAGFSANGRGGAMGAPEFTPVDNDDADDDGPTGTPRPIGRLSIYTLHEDKTKEFDRLAERAAEGVRAAEPDTLVYVIHVVPKAPMQRIMYEIYRDRAAFLSHERQPHIRQFAVDRAPCVLATNVIDLRLKYAKVAALGGPPEAAGPHGYQPRPADVPGGDRYQPAAAFQEPQYQRPPQPQPQYQQAQQHEPRFQEAAPFAGQQYQDAQPGGQYAGAQYERTQFSGAQYNGGGYQGQHPAEPPTVRPAAVASFTPAKDRYPAENRQYAATGREHYPTIAQYDNAANGSYGQGNGQYDAANGHSGSASYANGGSYPSGNGYPGANGYSGDNGYQGSNGYSGSNGYQSANGYSETNGYSNGNGYRGADGYSNGAGYSGGADYSNGAGYSNGPGNSNGAGYSGGPGYANGGYSNAATQYAPRYRELTSGGQPALEAGGQPADGGQPAAGDRYGDGRQSARASDRDRPQDRR